MNRLKRIRGELDQLIEADPKLRALRPHLKIDLVQEGLRIQIIDSQNRPMFKTGSAEVEPYMRDILRGIAPVLNEIPNKISLSGHTDDYPYATGERGYSNWELSADRANASRRELVAGAGRWQSFTRHWDVKLNAPISTRWRRCDQPSYQPAGAE